MIQLIKDEDLLLVLVLYDSILNIFRLWRNGLQTEDLPMSLLFTFYRFIHDKNNEQIH